MTLEQIKEYVRENGSEEAFVFDNYCSAFIGVSDEGRAVYDYNKMVESLVTEDGMGEEDAVDWICYNTIRSLPYMGKMAPIILYQIIEDNLC